MARTLRGQTPEARAERSTRGTVGRGRAPSERALLSSSTITAADVETAAATFRRDGVRGFGSLLDAATEDLDAPTPEPTPEPGI